MGKKIGCDEVMVMNGEDNLGEHCSQTSQTKKKDFVNDIKPPNPDDGAELGINDAGSGFS